MKAGFTHETNGKTNVEWYTPPAIFDGLGKFDLDPCQPPKGIDWIPAARYYSIHDDGLKQPWEGRIWLNPPYGNNISAWLERMHHHRQGIALVFSRTGTGWYRDYVATADAILFLQGRVKFVDGRGKSKGSGAGCSSLLIAWGAENVEALKRISHRGHLVINQRPS